MGMASLAPWFGVPVQSWMAGRVARPVHRCPPMDGKLVLQIRSNPTQSLPTKLDKPPPACAGHARPLPPGGGPAGCRLPLERHGPRGRDRAGAAVPARLLGAGAELRLL